MLNLRGIDGKFYLSGGWVDVPNDAKWLQLNEFRAVLDLQFTKDDYFPKSAQFIKDTLEYVGIDYYAIPMNDGLNQNIDSLFEVGYNILDDWDKKYTHRRDKILVKCGVGVSRSVAMLANYYCTRDRLTFTEARSRIQRIDKFNSGGLPIMIADELDFYLRNEYPDLSAFGERE